MYIVYGICICALLNEKKHVARVCMIPYALSCQLPMDKCSHQSITSKHPLNLLHALNSKPSCLSSCVEWIMQLMYHMQPWSLLHRRVQHLGCSPRVRSHHTHIMENHHLTSEDEHGSCPGAWKERPGKQPMISWGKHPGILEFLYWQMSLIMTELQVIISSSKIRHW